MNKTLDEGLELIQELLAKLDEQPTDVPVVLGTPYIHLAKAADMLKGKEGVYLAAQNCHQESSGAYTGEISVDMLKSVGVEYVILGHSERRQYFEESDTLVTEKLLKALDVGLKVIWCCGEPIEVREKEVHEGYVNNQLMASIRSLENDQLANVVIAYEPIWAIGTGRTATPQQAQDMHAFIRGSIAEKFGEEVAQTVTILYGGSCKPGNAEELFSQPDVDGGLIGGASLKVDDFAAIIHSF